MKWDKVLKQAIMEQIAAAYARNPHATREEAREEVLDFLHYERPDLGERVAEVMTPYGIENLVGEFIRSTRSRIKKAVLSGQQVDDALSGLPPVEAVRGVMLVIPLGGGQTVDKPALSCSRSEIRAARRYYGESRANMAQREAYCAAIEDAPGWEELPADATVRDLYRAA